MAVLKDILHESGQLITQDKGTAAVVAIGILHSGGEIQPTGGQGLLSCVGLARLSTLSLLLLGPGGGEVKVLPCCRHGGGGAVPLVKLLADGLVVRQLVALLLVLGLQLDAEALVVHALVIVDQVIPLNRKNE